MFLETNFGLLSVKPRVCLRKVEFVAGWLLLGAKQVVGNVVKGVGRVCGAGNSNKHSSLGRSCSPPACLTREPRSVQGKHQGRSPAQAEQECRSCWS